MSSTINAMAFTICVACAVAPPVGFLSTSPCAADDGNIGDVPRPPDLHEFESERPGRSCYSIPIPDPLSSRDMAVACWLLGATEEQREKFSEIFRKHEVEQRRTRVELIRPVLERSADIYASYPRGSLQAGLELEELIRHDRARVVRKLERLDQQLFETMSLQLTEDQRPHLELVKGLRRRAEMSNEGARYPCGNLDIVLLLHEVLEQQGLPLISEDKELHDLLVSYNNQATPAFQAREDALLKVRTDGSVLQKKQMNGLVNADWANEQLKSYRRRLVRAEERIHDMDKRYIELFSPLLDSDVRDSMTARWRVLAFKPVYPDPTNIGELFDAALELDLTDAARNTVISLMQSMEFDHAAHNERMIRRLLKYREEQAIEWRTGEIYSDYEADILRLHDQRIKLAKQGIEWLRATLPAAGWAHLEAQAAALITEMERFELVADERVNPSPADS